MVGGLDLAGKGVLAGGGGNGMERGADSGSVLTRRRRLFVSAGLDCGVGAGAACKRPVVAGRAAPGGWLANGCRTGSGEECASGRTMCFG